MLLQVSYSLVLKKKKETTKILLKREVFQTWKSTRPWSYGYTTVLHVNGKKWCASWKAGGKPDTPSTAPRSQVRTKLSVTAEITWQPAEAPKFTNDHLTNLFFCWYVHILSGPSHYTGVISDCRYKTLNTGKLKRAAVLEVSQLSGNFCFIQHFSAKVPFTFCSSPLCLNNNYGCDIQWQKPENSKLAETYSRHCLNGLSWFCFTNTTKTEIFISQKTQTSGKGLLSEINLILGREFCLTPESFLLVSLPFSFFKWSLRTLSQNTES